MCIFFTLVFLLVFCYYLVVSLPFPLLLSSLVHFHNATATALQNKGMIYV